MSQTSLNSSYKTTVPNCFYRLSVKALILDAGGKFLLTQETNGIWDLPGGGLDHGEHPIQGIKREIKEETGLDIYDVQSTPSFFITTTHDRTGTHIANIIYKAKLQNLDFIHTRECCNLQFFTVEQAENLPHYNNVKVFLQELNSQKH